VCERVSSKCWVGVSFCVLGGVGLGLQWKGRRKRTRVEDNMVFRRGKLEIPESRREIEKSRRERELRREVADAERELRDCKVVIADYILFLCAAVLWFAHS
jgi:hypothetical protein